MCFNVIFSISVAHSIEPKLIDSGDVCPHDSTATEGACKCNHAHCVKPSCEGILYMTRNYTDHPGECCPIYTCNDCDEINLIDGRCRCAPGAFKDPVGNCKCDNPLYTLNEVNGCQCDPAKCPLPSICDDQSVAVKKFDDCCTNVACITCPEDSYPKRYNDDEIEDLCLCYPCPKARCNGTDAATPVVIRQGKNFPGSCCDIYECKSQEQTAMADCHVNETMYLHDDTWKASDGSDCMCENGIALCKKSPMTVPHTFATCWSGDKIYPHLSSWIEGTCTNCTCFDGLSKCIAHMCDVNISEFRCQSLVECKKKCEFGFKINKKGCEVCKCKPVIKQSRYQSLETYLDDINMSEQEALTLLQSQAYMVKPTERTVVVFETTRQPHIIQEKCLHSGNVMFKFLQVRDTNFNAILLCVDF